MNPGEYLAPFPRKTLVQCPVVSGYVTARLQDQCWFPPVTSGMPTSMMCTFENVGNTHFSVVLNQTGDRSISGTRTPLAGFSGSDLFLVPGGQQTVTLTGHEKYVEVYCTGTTSGALRLQIESQRTWTEMGFDRLDPFYPPSLWQAKEVPGALT